MGPKLALAGVLLTIGSPAWAQDPGATEAARALEVAADAIDDTLQDADAKVARAAQDLGRTGLTGRQAHARLASLCEDLTYAVSCSALDDEGVLVTEAPAAFTGVEGRRVQTQAHVQRMLERRQPVLSDAFRAVEGFDAVALAHPVFSRDGQFLGSVSMVARPASLVGHAVKPAFPEGLPEIAVVQRDGYPLYDADADEIGRNAPSTTVGLHGTEWRVAVAETMDGRGPPVARYEEPDVPIPAEVGLDALVALTEGHMTGIVEDFGLIAAEGNVRSGEWARIEEPLRRVSAVNVPAVYWYAEPDGSYWSVDKGLADATLSDRPYFRKALAGEVVVGELIVSKSSGRTAGIVAVPVKGDRGEVVGVLGASVYLDQLSAQIRDELGLGEGLWFYAFDEDQRLALHPDPERVFLTAGELGPEVGPWFQEMQIRREGVMRYTYEGRPRTLVYRRSPVTGWTYAFGFVGERAPGA